MADDPTDNGDDVPVDPASRFLIALWGYLDTASEMAIDPKVICRLDELRDNCERAVSLIRAWQAAQH